MRKFNTSRTNHAEKYYTIVKEKTIIAYNMNNSVIHIPDFVPNYRNCFALLASLVNWRSS